MALAGVGQHFSRNLDQYTIMCVFGSVVGCVVLPLMAHSLESLIITAILFGVTVKTLNKKAPPTSGGGAREQVDERKKDKKTKKSLSMVKRHPQPIQVAVDGEVVRQQRELDLIRKEELRAHEKEQKMEEKRKKKAKKREEKLQKRKEEKIEKEKQDLAVQQRKKEREERKKKPAPITDLPDYMSLSEQRPVRRERKHSTSSTASSGSTYSTPPHSAPPPRRRKPPPRTPTRASSAPLMMATPPKRMTATPPASLQECQQPIAMEMPPVPPSHPAPVQMVRALSLLPFLSPPQAPHPHFMYGPQPHVQMDHTHSTPTANLFERDRNVTGGKCASGMYQLQPDPIGSHVTPVWSESHVTGNTTGHVIGISAALKDSRSGPPKNHVPHAVSSTAQGFYSFLNDQAMNSDPASYSSNSIWTPAPSASQSVREGEGLEEWPQWVGQSQ